MEISQHRHVGLNYTTRRERRVLQNLGLLKTTNELEVAAHVNFVWRHNIYRNVTLIGRLSYIAMALIVFNPQHTFNVMDVDVKKILFINMLIGYTSYFLSRISIMEMNFSKKLLLSILGSLMFNQSSLRTFNYFASKIGGQTSVIKIGLTTLVGLGLAQTINGFLMSYFAHVDRRVLGYYMCKHRHDPSVNFHF